MHFIKQHLTGFSRRSFLAAFMAFVMAACLFLPAGDAFALDRPKWLGVKIKSWKIVRNDKVTDVSKPGYQVVSLVIAHTNNSADKVVTTFYDKKVSVTLEGDSIITSGAIKSTRVNRVTLDPGASYTLSYNIPLTWMRLVIYGTQKPFDWSSANNRLKNQKKFKISKWSYDCKVKSKGI